MGYISSEFNSVLAKATSSGKPFWGKNKDTFETKIKIYSKHFLSSSNPAKQNSEATLC